MSLGSLSHTTAPYSCPIQLPHLPVPTQASVVAEGGCGSAAARRRRAHVQGLGLGFRVWYLRFRRGEAEHVLQCATRIPQPQTRNRCTSTLLTCKKWYDKQRELTPKATPSLLHTLQRKWYAKQSGASHLSKDGV